MKRLIVILTFAMLFMSAAKSEAGCYVRYRHYGPRPVVVCRVYQRAWIPGYWRWDWRVRRYFWVSGYWY